jgi:hypothetical protein
MKKSDQYFKWVEWSEEDQVYIGRCPGLVPGIHREDNDQVQLYKELCDLVDEIIEEKEAAGRPLPDPTYSPLQRAA